MPLAIHKTYLGKMNNLSNYSKVFLALMLILHKDADKLNIITVHTKNILVIRIANTIFIQMACTVGNCVYVLDLNKPLCNVFICKVIPSFSELSFLYCLRQVAMLE